MNDVILKVLIRLFALISNLNKDRITATTLNEMKEYLLTIVNKNELDQYWQLFNYWLNHYKRNLDKEKETDRVKFNNAFKRRADNLCEQINLQLNSKQKIYILIQLLEYLKVDTSKPVDETEIDFVNSISDKLLINKKDYANLAPFILESINEVPVKSDMLIVNNLKKDLKNPKIKHLININLGIGYIHFLFIKSTNTFIFKYKGEHNLYLNSTIIIQNKINIFSVGSYIGSSRINPIYYRNIADKFLKHLVTSEKFVFKAQNINYKFKDGYSGVTDFTLNECSGNLIGILGGSGVGKSTLFNVLNGTLKPTSGSVTVNGFDIHENKKATDGLIGFVPQDDLLFESLTVYENLLYNAKLCFNNLSSEEIEQIIHTTVKAFRLSEAKDFIVGDPINKILSGGQRKRLNIALEVMRDPQILFVDEPTSGLSSVDSEYIISILKRQSLLGRLVFANIHQPSSDIFKQFDKLIVLDQGGTIIYYGNPIDALVYFRQITNHVNAFERECSTCHNVRVEQILRIVEARTVDEAGRRTRERKTSASEWHKIYREKILPKYKQRKYYYKKQLKPSLHKPNKFKQLTIFVRRDVSSKLRNYQYVLFSFVLSPVLAFILSYFTKKVTNAPEHLGQYIYSDNTNLPVYIFMSIIVALFIGLMSSAEDIIKDRKIRQRERFLNLSWISYVNAKIFNLFIISAIQSFLFVIVGNTILEIPDLFFKFWLILFLCLSLSNVIGLNLSASLKSVVSIYIFIPIIVVPQLLFGGVIVDYNKQYTDIINEQKVPLIAEMFSSKGAYEALMYSAFKENKFNRNFYDLEKQISETEFTSSFAIPALSIKLCNNNLTKSDIEIIKKELDKISNITNKKIDIKDELTRKNIGQYKSSIEDYIKESKKILITKYNKILNSKDSIYSELQIELGEININDYKNKHHNNAIETIVTNEMELIKIIETNSNYAQISNPIYRTPTSNDGRTQMFAPQKKIFGFYIDTFTFNSLMIILRIFLWIIVLYNGLINKVARKIGHIQYIFKNKKIK